MDEILAAARAVVEQHGTPGAMARTKALEVALLTAEADLAVVVAAARWTDRYGRVGASDAYHALESALLAAAPGTPADPQASREGMTA